MTSFIIGLGSPEILCSSPTQVLYSETSGTDSLLWSDWLVEVPSLWAVKMGGHDLVLKIVFLFL